MLKLRWTSLFAAAFLATAVAADPKIIEPLEAIEQFGGFAVSDGSSYFSFSKDGSFESGPIRSSGRTMSGRWAKGTNGRLVATAKLGWENGFQPAAAQYRRVVFHVSYLTKRAVPIALESGKPAEIFDSYFFIDEMTSIPTPPEEIKK